MNRFSKFLNSSARQKCMPLLHTCDGYAFREVVEQKKLKTSPCNVYKGESLLYFFYGRPSYRTSRNIGPVSHEAFMPVVILLSPDAVRSPKRIAPFDTGAFDSMLFEAHMHPEMDRDDFLLEPQMDMPSRLVSKFYGSNEQYYNANPIHLDISPLEFEAKSYYSLISSKVRTSYDDRKETVEIQTEKDIALNQSNVQLIVLPNVFMDNDELRDTIISDWQSDVRTYPIHHGDPNEYLGFLYREVESYLESKDYI
ncbi:MAG: hypothetical protein V3T17_14845 [Pseudomonadales bacterium]